jgi:Ca-activated chloride channel family protein
MKKILNLLLVAALFWLGSCSSSKNPSQTKAIKQPEPVVLTEQKEVEHTIAAPAREMTIDAQDGAERKSKIGAQLFREEYKAALAKPQGFIPVKDMYQKKMTTQIVYYDYDMNSNDDKPSNTEEYAFISENKFQSAKNTPLSTFSIDVDAASYSNSRRVINSGTLPQQDMVRTEEFINYFDYDYPNPEGEHPFSVYSEVASCPWNEAHQLVHIGLQGKNIDYENLSASNLVFLLDVSGSMEAPNKLPLLRTSLKILLNELSAKDRVAIVVYAGAAGLVLPSTPASDKQTIIDALDKLHAGGSTAGGQGIELAYKVATDNFIADGNNRIILATDGDFNVGTSSTASLVRLIEEKRKTGVFLTICGFGMGNYKDSRMEQLSANGNGNYFYIDNLTEAKKVFATEMRATLFTIAKDVKIQVEFNPAQVKAYRLIGYENRALKNEEFNDDKKDAGELGAGHTVTALYEIIPVGVNSTFYQETDELKYQQTVNTSTAVANELLTVKLRYKKPKEDTSILLSEVVKPSNKQWETASENFRFSAAVAEFASLLRKSEFTTQGSYSQVLSIAKAAKGHDKNGYRDEFIKLVESCQIMSGEAVGAKK